MHFFIPPFPGLRTRTYGRVPPDFLMSSKLLAEAARLDFPTEGTESNAFEYFAFSDGGWLTVAKFQRNLHIPRSLAAMVYD